MSQRGLSGKKRMSVARMTAGRIWIPNGTVRAGLVSGGSDSQEGTRLRAHTPVCRRARDAEGTVAEPTSYERTNPQHELL